MSSSPRFDVPSIRGGSRFRVVAVVLNLNGGDRLLSCVEHLLCQDPVPPSVLVVDNGSSDDSLERLRAAATPCDVIALTRNEGFAAGMNVGLTEAIRRGAAYVWMVNNDAFPDADCLATLLHRLDKDETLGMLTPRLRSSDGGEQPAGGIVNWCTGESRLLMAHDLDPDRHGGEDGTWITGTAPIFRVTALERSGLLEPAFFAYWEDIDLSVRMTRCGFRIGAEAAAGALHLGGATSGGRSSPTVAFLDTRNRWLFLERNARIGSRRLRWWRYAAIAIRRSAWCDLTGDTLHGTALLAGISAARAKQFFAPPTVFNLAVHERVCRRAPWRASAWLMRAADWLDGSPQSSTPFPNAW